MLGTIPVFGLCQWTKEESLFFWSVHDRYPYIICIVWHYLQSIIWSIYTSEKSPLLTSSQAGEYGWWELPAPGLGENKTMNILSSEGLYIWWLLAFWYFLYSEGILWVHVMSYLLCMTLFLQKRCFASQKLTCNQTSGTYPVCKVGIIGAPE